MDRLKSEAPELHRQKAQKWDNAVLRFQRKEYPKRPAKDDSRLVMGRIWMGQAVASVPADLCGAFSNVATFITLSLLEDIGMLKEPGFNRCLVAQYSPGRTTVGRLLREFTSIIQLSYISKILRAPVVYLPVDKSERGRNVNKVSHLAKVLCFVDNDRENPEPVAWPFCVDGSANNSFECVKAIEHSLKFKLLGSNVKLSGVMGDNGGADSGMTLWREMVKLGLSTNEFIIANCSHHNIQLLFAPGVTKLMGVGGIESKTLIQRLHCAKYLQDAHERLEWTVLRRIKRLLIQGVHMEAIDVNVLVKDKTQDVKAELNAVTTRWNETGRLAQRAAEKDEKVEKLALKHVASCNATRQQKQLTGSRQATIPCSKKKKLMETKWVLDVFKK
jgi:hypothetical protein